MTGRLLLDEDGRRAVSASIVCGAVLNALTMGSLCPVVIRPHTLGTELCVSSGEDRPSGTA